MIIPSCSKEEKIYDYTSPVYRNLMNNGQEYREKEYKKLKIRINKKQHLYYEEYARSGDAHRKDLMALSKKYVLKTMTDTIFPYWYGTRWDYNGITQTPGKGKIACGYFVTTTLRDMGFKLERASLAQQASSNIIESLCGKGSAHVIGHNDMDQLEKHLLSKPDGLFIMGLDNHVGYLLKEGESISAIHSNGVSGSMQVVKEPMRSCKLMLRSQAYYVASLTENKKVKTAWIKKHAIKTVR